MARDIARDAPPGLLGAPAAIVPVPAQRWRRRVRGYDHAESLARALGALSGRPVIAALERVGRPGARQRGLRRDQRLAGEGLAIRARSGRVPRAAVLVDDVCTTGATLAACALALRAGGASRVAAVAYARAL
jgi:predicted amidophosphoribosyltransferase